MLCGQAYELNHVKSNRKKSRESCKNLTQTESNTNVGEGYGFDNEGKAVLIMNGQATWLNCAHVPVFC